MLQLVGIKNALGRKTKGKQSENTLKALFDISSVKQYLCEMHSTILLCYEKAIHAFKGRSKAREKNAAIVRGVSKIKTLVQWNSI